MGTFGAPVVWRVKAGSQQLAEAGVRQRLSALERVTCVLIGHPGHRTSGLGLTLCMAMTAEGTGSDSGHVGALCHRLLPGQTTQQNCPPPEYSMQPLPRGPSVSEGGTG